MNKYIPAKITLILGYDCNLHCRHCVSKERMSMHKGMITEQELSNIYNIINSEITKKIYNQSKMNIYFFGGEPLIYFDKLKGIVNYLETTYGDKFKFSITTNGTLLNEKIIQYCNDYDFTVNVSYDGYDSQYLRGFDVLKEKEDLLYKVNLLSIYSVLSAYNYPLDLFNSATPFCTKYYEIHNHHCNILLFPMIDLKNEFRDYYAINHQKWSDQIQQILHSDEPFIQYCINQYKHKLQNNYAQLENHLSMSQQDMTDLKMPRHCANCQFYSLCGLHGNKSINHDKLDNHCNLMKLTFMPFLNLL